MKLSVFSIFLCMGACYAGYTNEGHAVDYFVPAHYQFHYGVSDPHTGDKKQQFESRHGDVVKGSYSLHEPDGTIRIVEYTSDPHTGFKAVVKKIGKAVHPQYYKKYDGESYGGSYGYGGHGGGISYTGPTKFGGGYY